MVEDLISKIKKGEIAPERAWDEIRSLKDAYIRQYSEQSWHVYIGNRFQNLIYSILKAYFGKLKVQQSSFRNVEVFTEDEVKRNEIIIRKLSVKFGDYLLLPDTDMVIVDYNLANPWNSEVLAIVSCKTSSRERIAQACYWKLKLLSSDVTKNIRVFLTTTDNDEDFSINKTSRRERFDGKHRNRIIAEYELDGVYILREDFKEEWESSKVKLYNHIFDDLTRIFRDRS
jgi:type II restriction enzyme